MIGKQVRGGIYGEPPSLTKLDNGNLRYTTDFRSVLGELVRGHLGQPVDRVFPGFAVGDPLGLLKV